MDKKSILAFALIGIMLVVYTLLSRPSLEQKEKMQRYKDSITAVQLQQQLEQLEQLEKVEKEEIQKTATLPDSLLLEKRQNELGVFAQAGDGNEQFISLENEKIKVTFTSKGGRVYSAQLREFTTHDSLPLLLFDQNESSFGLTMITANNRIIDTEQLFFEPIQNNPDQLIMRLHAGENAHMDFIYSLNKDDYMVRFEISNHHMSEVLASNTNVLDIRWSQKVRQLEKNSKYENQRTHLSYKYSVENAESLSDSKDDQKNVPNKIKWIGHKNQYFSSVLIADNDFDGAKMKSIMMHSGHYLKEFSTNTGVTFHPNDTKNIGFYYYFGPNNYALLKKYDRELYPGQDLQLEKLVYLGMSLFRYVNKWIVIPLFDFLTHLCGNLGLSIFLLTLIIRMGLFPLTYKSFMSSAKMRVMRPQVDELNAKFPGQENAMTRQQKTMEIYRQVGVNPMSGCLPMLLQMPFWLALFMFFPSAIQLRHQSFLWASDLSTYDAVISWNAYIPLVTPYFGNHISLFCLLMTISTLLTTKFSMDQNAGQQQMPGMKMMMYVMPIMMLVFLNQFPAGLNYYYFVSSLIGILQTVGFRLVVNENRLKIQLENYKKKPPKKKSGFMARLEEAQRQQQALAKQRAKQQRRR